MSAQNGKIVSDAESTMIRLVHHGGIVDHHGLLGPFFQDEDRECQPLLEDVCQAGDAALSASASSVGLSASERGGCHERSSKCLSCNFVSSSMALSFLMR